MSMTNKQALDAFKVAVEAAESAKEASSDSRWVAKLLTNVTGLLTFMGETADETPTGYDVTTKRLSDWASEWASLSGEDRSEGEALATNVTGRKMAELFSSEELESADLLLARWSESSPKRSRGEGSGTKGETKPYKVRVTCGECGKVVATQQAGTGGYRNSIRYQAQTHARDEHGVTLKKSANPALFDEVTGALDKVIGGSDKSEGGGFTFTKVADLTAVA